jgi:hypothetical protein
MTPTQNIHCKNCNTEVHLNYCPNCAQPVKLKRINGHYILHEIEHVLHFEKGILYTIRELVLRPGQSIRNFISENRSRLIKPIIFIIIASLIYTLASHFFHIEEPVLKAGQAENTATASIIKWIYGHLGYSNIIMGVFIALWLKLFFRKYDYNFYEILILLCFAMGIGMLFFAFFVVLQGLTHVNLTMVRELVFFLYCAWAIGQFFDKKKAINYVKALIAYLLGMVTFWFCALLLGQLIDQIIKH